MATNPAMENYARAWEDEQQAEIDLREASTAREEARKRTQARWRDCAELPEGAYVVMTNRCVVKNNVVDYPPVLSLKGVDHG